MHTAICANTPIRTGCLVVGGGNAALNAAIAARIRGASVTLLEAAPQSMRGGNSRHTRNLRVAHDAPLRHLHECYDADEFLDDLIKVTGGNTDMELAQMTIKASTSCLAWLAANGVHFQPCLSGTLSLGRTNAFFLGGGKALINALYRRAAAMGVTIHHDTEVQDIEFDGRRVTRVIARHAGVERIFIPDSVVVACGGYEANLDWLAETWGAGAHNFLVRGTPWNRGKPLRSLLDRGAQPAGDPAQFHAVAIDGRAAKFDSGIVTRLDCVPFSIVVNRAGRRFHDEGEDLWPKRYAIWGRLVASQPDQTAFAILDASSQGLFMPPVFAPVVADDLETLAQKLEIPAAPLMETVTRFNACCVDGHFQPDERDGLATAGLDPPKSNWARPIVTPPFSAWSLKPGITFTYLGLKVDGRARVLGPDGPADNLFAAGEIMAGSLLGRGYLAGFGMTIGTVFGRIAGEEAARNAH